jgi:Mce-associated membrane protein
MEGDAGASRLNPNEIDDSSSSEVKAEDSSESEDGTDQTSTEVKAEDSAESEDATDQTSTEVKAEDSAESEDGTDQTSTEAKAEDSAESEDGTDQTSAEATEEGLDQDAEDSSESEIDTEGDTDDVADDGKPSRLGRGWLVGIAAALVVAAGGVGAGGYLALRSHRESQDIARRDDAAVQAAKDCVAATQAPDTTAMAASAQKIIDCGTGAFRSQAILYSGLLVEAYQAANAQVQVSDLRAAVERNNSDGSVDVLVPLRVKVSNSATQNQEAGYRLRVTMVSDEGKYRIAKLDQVAK